MKKNCLKIAIVCWVIAFIVLIPLVQGCGYSKWSKKDQLLFGSFIALQAVDLAQYDQDDELNWFKGESQATVGLIKLAGIGLVYVIASYWEDARTEMLIGVNVVSGGVVVWNASQ